MTPPSFARVPVAGGDLAYADLTPGASPDAPLVVLVHGITANALTWVPVARELAARHGTALRLWAPDLRGRGDSRALTHPRGIAAHVDDVAALADAAGASRFTLAGHSMGGFVTALFAARHGDRLTGAVLVDGGFAFPMQAGTDIDATLQLVIGPAMSRLSMTFPSPEAYLEFWEPHPAVGPLLRGPRGDVVREYLLHDLVAAPDGSGAYVSSCVADVIRADGRDILADPDCLAAGRRAAADGVSLELLWAERGLMNEPIGLYDDDRIAALDLPGAVRARGIDDVDHYGILFDPRAVAAVCDAIDRASVPPAAVTP